MNESKNSSGGGGISFFGALTILFIGLKMTGHIDWSWWWVLSPIWGSVLVVIAMVLAFVLGYVIYKLCGGKHSL